MNRLPRATDVARPRVTSRAERLSKLRESTVRRREGKQQLYALITPETHAEIAFIRDAWGLRYAHQAISLALLYMAQSTREGLVHPRVPGFEHVKERY